MDMKEQRDIIDKLKRCQRNWDHSKSITNEHLEHLIYIATNSPSKQYEAYYNLYVITNRKLLSELLDNTWGFTLPINDDTPVSEVPSCIRNPQMDASAYFLWTTKKPETMRNFNKDGSERVLNWGGRNENAILSCGISMGLVGFAAHTLGYVTGYNKNHDGIGIEQEVWFEKLNIDPEETMVAGVGIGHGLEGKPWNYTTEHELLIGHPQKIRVDTSTIRSIKYNDKVYNVRDKIEEFPSFSSKPRDIEVKRYY